MQIDQPVQPGIPFLFPWLHKLAGLFETYRIIKLVFFYKATSADAVLSSSASTALGSVIMMAQYNVLADPPISKREMLNNATAKSIKPSNSCAFPVNPHSSYKTLFVRTPTTPEGGDRRLYDQCDFHLATEGMQGAPGSGAIGELSVMAVMQFSKPTLGNQGVPIDLFIFNNAYVPNVIGNNTFALTFDNNGDTTTKLYGATGSSLMGYLKEDPTDNSFEYHFSDVACSVIGAIYQVQLNFKLGASSGTYAEFYQMHMKDPFDAGVWLDVNCTRVPFLGSYGQTTGDEVNPGTIASIVYTPAHPAYEPNANTGFSTNFFLRIDGPRATFGVDNSDNNNLLNWRWFQDGTPGAPSLPTMTGPFIQTHLTVTQVSLP